MTDAIFDKLLHDQFRRTQGEPTMSLLESTSLSDIANAKWRETHNSDECPPNGERLYIGHPHYAVMEYGRIHFLGWCEVPVTAAGALVVAQGQIAILEREIKKIKAKLNDTNAVAALVDIETPEMANNDKPQDNPHSAFGDLGMSLWRTKITLEKPGSDALEAIFRLCGCELPAPSKDGYTDINANDCEMAIEFQGVYPERWESQ